MAFARGKFGIEYNTAPRREEPGPLVPILVALVFAVALGSLVWTVYGRLRGDRVEDEQVRAAKVEDLRATASAEKAAEEAAEKSVSLAGVADLPPRPAPKPAAARESREYPVAVRNLLSRLKEAERKGDVEMAITTIEQIRALPGRPAADLDGELARKLGILNLQRLFTMRSPLWTVDVTVGRGDSASFLASEHGSTLVSMARLNPKVDLNRLRIGQKLKVMNHPSFRLEISRATRTADLQLNGRFFKRYALAGDVRGAAGTYALPANAGPFWASVGILLTRADRRELTELLPKGTPVILPEP